MRVEEDACRLKMKSEAVAHDECQNSWADRRIRFVNHALIDSATVVFSETFFYFQAFFKICGWLFQLHQSRLKLRPESWQKYSGDRHPSSVDT